MRGQEVRYGSEADALTGPTPGAYLGRPATQQVQLR